MSGEKGERWRELCVLIAEEQDHQKLIELVEELNRLLEEKENQAKQPPK